ncbi:TMEM43 family protein [Imhoffiella purpurea]|uniref:Transmembrane protein n=1 Tax=Imhoffiella purpurea TaxID=1249627 RepID=W9VVI7_9GAMM|nr:TMEM43 family protein [Imhoffiella purpurea]EXJ14420.1 hypothetical protein D779_2561 [Imhoffiella purpurea]
MTDVYRQTSSTSWFGRLGRSMKGILFGGLLAIAAFPLLWWNEGRAIDRTHTLEAGRSAVISAAADAVDPAHEDRLIHTSGLATTDEILEDATFGVAVEALRLRRRVEMYQWRQHKSTSTSRGSGGTEETETTYRYDKEWADHWIDSGTFEYRAGHENPSRMPFGSEDYEASEVTLGAFRLGKDFVDQIDAFEPYRPTETAAVPPGFEPYGDGYYRGTPQSPEIGDIRVRFASVGPTTVSLVGRQVLDGIEIAHMPKGTISLLELGRVDSETMFAKALDANAALTWGLRFAGILLLWIGLKIVLEPLRVLADIVPLVGGIVGAGTSLVAGLVALSLGFVTIAVAWIFYRPLLAGGLIAAALVLLGLSAFKIKRAEPVPEAAGPS